MARIVNIIRNPVGTYNFAGCVPIGLAYSIIGGSRSQRKEIEDCVQQCGPGFARKLAKRYGVRFQTRIFDSAAEARAFATGYRQTSGLEFEIDG